MTLVDVDRRLREFIAALDRRTRDRTRPAEAAIARDAAVLRKKAVTRLAEIARLKTLDPNVAPGASIDAGRGAVPHLTAFPVKPGDVAALTVEEFTPEFDALDGDRAPSMEQVCRTFKDDANRALVWWIRFGALKAWAATEARASAARTLRDAREAAASCPLNDQWEFDPDRFALAIDAVAANRAGADR